MELPMVRTVSSRFAVRGIAACSLLGLLLFGGELPLSVSVAPEANRNSPIAVELVIAYDGKVLDELLKMPAGDWFRKREQFLRDHPGGMDTWKWEWIPGQKVKDVEL